MLEAVLQLLDDFVFEQVLLLFNRPQLLAIFDIREFVGILFNVTFSLFQSVFVVQ